jgi:glycosyltransferase involved in cell wall biosynthesis
MDEYLSAEDKNSLVASCDAYVSLHRSEGFGISLAEAMLLGKPVIASEYSGSADFVRPNTAYPVRCTITDIGPGNEPYMAVYHPKTNAGIVHYATRTDLPSKKVFSWGSDAEGLQNERAGNRRHALN